MKRRGILVVGQAPGPSTVGRPALDGASGRKLAELFGFEHVRDFADAVNLLEHWPGRPRKGTKGCRFPMREARSRAPLIKALFPRYHVVVILGAASARALGFEGPPLTWHIVGAPGDGRCIFGGTIVGLLPHTSGANHWWNPHENRIRGREFARHALAMARARGPRHLVRLLEAAAPGRRDRRWQSPLAGLRRLGP